MFVLMRLFMLGRDVFRYACVSVLSREGESVNMDGSAGQKVELVFWIFFFQISG